MDDEQLDDVLKQRAELTNTMSQMWQDEGLTALISPFWPSVAPRGEDMKDMGLMIEYSGLWNMNGFPAGVIPVTEVLENE